jgi:hypothetical protein
VLQEVNKKYNSTGKYNKSGIDLFAEDWDNLIILDAARPDAFEEVVIPNFDGNYEIKESRGSATPEWVRGNFTERSLLDVVYITGSSWFLRLRNEIDSEVFDVYPILDRNIERKFEKVTNLALKQINNHPNKRILVHYTVPHHPYQGAWAKKNLPPYEEQQRPEFFEDILENRIDITDDDLYRAHCENLEIILPCLNKLIDKLDGKTVITADHAELLGDKIGPIPMKGYGHPSGLHVNKLLEVPWLELSCDSRRKIVSGKQTNTNKKNISNAVDDQLRSLGYKL